MTRRDNPNTSTFRRTAAFIAFLTVVIALAAAAQTERSLSPGKSPAGGGSHAVAPSTFRPMDRVSPLFLPTVIYDSGGLAAVSVVVEDLNRDGKADLVVANYCAIGGCNFDATVGVLLGNGDGTFQPAMTYDLGEGNDTVTSLAVGDVNRDGKADIAVTVGLHVSILLGNGDGTFQPFVAYDPGSCVGDPCANGVALADVNGDGKLDLVVSNSSNTIGVLLGKGDGTFKKAKTYASGGSNPGPVAVEDMNGDGKLDIAVANVGDAPGTVSVLLGNGNGTFRTAVTYPSGGWPVTALAVADLNGDGKPDLVVSICSQGNTCAVAEAGLVGVLLNTGDGTFQEAVTYDSGGDDALSVAVADVNGDGKPDLLVGNRCSCFTGTGALGVLLGNGDGTFQSAETYDSGNAQPSSIAVEDVNGDGQPDLAVASMNYLMGGSVGVLLHVGTTPTATKLISDSNPAVPGQTVTYTAGVTSQSGKQVTGTVTFWDGDVPVATVGLVGNQSSYNTAYKSGNIHTITAIYSGDVDNDSSVSAVLTEKITKPPFSTSTSINTSGSPSFIGQPVTITATVTCGTHAIPDGELVTFYDGTTVIGTGSTANGVATLTIALETVKKYTIKGTYSGDANFKPSSGTITQVVVKQPTTTTLTSTPNPSAHGQAVTFTATVTSGGPTPTGTVRFLDGAKSFGSATLSSGGAKLTKSTLAVGTHSITAEYLGDAASDKSTSPVVNQVVQ
jgi:hypothetical protein